MDDGRVIRLTWAEWKAGRAAKRFALAAHGLSGESRRTTARPEARRCGDGIMRLWREARADTVSCGGEPKIIP